MATKRKLKTRESQRTAWKNWAAANPKKAQANRNAWAKSPPGLRWLRKNQKKKNRVRDLWRLRKKQEAKKNEPPQQ